MYYVALNLRFCSQSTMRSDVSIWPHEEPEIISQCCTQTSPSPWQKTSFWEPLLWPKPSYTGHLLIRIKLFLIIKDFVWSHWWGNWSVTVSFNGCFQSSAFKVSVEVWSQVSRFRLLLLLLKICLFWVVCSKIILCEMRNNIISFFQKSKYFFWICWFSDERSWSFFLSPAEKLTFAENFSFHWAMILKDN